MVRSESRIWDEDEPFIRFLSSEKLIHFQDVQSFGKNVQAVCSPLFPLLSVPECLFFLPAGWESEDSLQKSLARKDDPKFGIAEVSHRERKALFPLKMLLRETIYRRQNENLSLPSLSLDNMMPLLPAAAFRLFDVYSHTILDSYPSGPSIPLICSSRLTLVLLLLTHTLHKHSHPPLITETSHAFWRPDGNKHWHT